jgi:hypothetical protein
MGITKPQELILERDANHVSAETFEKTVSGIVAHLQELIKLLEDELERLRKQSQEIEAELEHL